MRSEALIIAAYPCDTDFRDKSIQTILQAKEKGRVWCSNYQQCEELNKKEGIQCTHAKVVLDIE